MSIDDYSLMLMAFGIAVGSVLRAQPQGQLFWKLMTLVNLINEGNPDFTPYEIPSEFQ